MKKGVQFIFFCLISLQLFAQNDTIKIGQLLISKPESKSNLSWEQIIKNKDLNGLKVNFKKSNNNFKQLETSWFGFATALASLAGKETSRVIPMSTRAYNSLATRPKYSVLSHDGWRDSPIFTLESCENALQEMFPKLIGSLSQHGEK